MGALEHEVAAEASPMLHFLANHARGIVIAVLLFIAAIGGYWAYSNHQSAKHGENTLALGKLLIISNDAMRLEKLQAFLATAPDSVRRETLFAIMEAANKTGDLTTVHDSWKQIGELDPSIRAFAAIGMADALSGQKKYAEALAVLTSAVSSSSLNAAESVPINARITLLAENLGDFDRAMTACDALLARPGSQVDVNMWAQKKAVLEKKAAAKKEQS
jgi:predicted negative regulator of RcsB-dependent stress response